MIGTKRETLHLRNFRPKRRRSDPKSAATVVTEVYALCGKWVPKRLAVRIDRADRIGLYADVCLSCSAVAS